MDMQNFPIPGSVDGLRLAQWENLHHRKQRLKARTFTLQELFFFFFFLEHLRILLSWHALCKKRYDDRLLPDGLVDFVEWSPSAPPQDFHSAHNRYRRTLTMWNSRRHTY